MEAARNIIQIPQENKFKVVKFELTPEAIAEMVKEYETLELIPGDKDSYKTVHEAKMICVKARTGTDKRRKELGADARQWINDVNSTAQDLIAPLLPLEEKLKAMLEEEDNREAKIAQEKADKIAGLMSSLETCIVSGQKYGLDAATIKAAIETLESFEISAVDFDTETERAEALKAEGLETLKNILADRERWESEQIEQAKIKAAQEAEAKKLSDERAAFEAQQEAARLEQKKKDDAAALIAAQEAEKTRKANEKLQQEREAIEKEKAQILADKYARDWDDAHTINIDIIHAVAISENSEFDRARVAKLNSDHSEALDINAEFDRLRKERLKADQARAKLVAIDKKAIQFIANELHAAINEIACPKMETTEGTILALDMVKAVKLAVEIFEKAGVELA